ncbi:MAG: hypothetical protein SGI92_27020 [Bryobacteraceae bacterium]|nr:hypothetical protein [Bryobacteraceae bacterium]
MRLRGWRQITVGLVLAGAGMLMTTPLPSQALVFAREFERSGKGTAQVSLQERVVYSLLEATEQTANHPNRCNTI